MREPVLEDQPAVGARKDAITSATGGDRSRVLARIRRNAPRLAAQAADALGPRATDLSSACLDAVRAFADFAAERSVPYEPSGPPGDLALVWSATQAVVARAVAAWADAPLAADLVVTLSELVENVISEASSGGDDVDHLVRGIVAGDAPPRVALDRIGLSADDELVVVVTTVAHADVPQAQAVRTLRGALQRSLPRPLTAILDDKVVAIAAPGIQARVELALVALRSSHAIIALAGVGSKCQGLREVVRSYDEARRSLRLARPNGAHVVVFEDVPLVDLLIAEADETARLLAEHLAGEVLVEDRRQGGALLDTLSAYVDSGFSVRRAAAKLLVHPNTVYYRLRRISEISGRDTRRFEDVANLMCAVRILSTDRS